MSKRTALLFSMPDGFIGVQFERELAAAGYDVLVSLTEMGGEPRVQVGGLAPGGATFGAEDWDAIDALLAAHDPAAYVAPVVVPTKVSRWRLYAVAELAGLTAQIDAAIAALPEPTRTVAHAGWYHAFELERSSVLLAQLGPALGLTDGDIDQMFRDAAAIVA